MADRPTASNVRLFYRAVSLEEFADIQLTGQLRQGPNSAKGKHLTGSVEEAMCFAGKLYPGGDFRIVEVSVSEAVARRFFLIGRLDACGRAWFAELEDLLGCTIAEVTP
jgi:hypothetical protein